MTIPHVTAAALTLSTTLALAQSPPAGELERIKSQHSICSGLTAPGMRAQCFESVSNRAIRLLTGASATAESAPAPPADSSAPSSAFAHDALVKAAKANITRALKDPSSAQFRNLFIGTGADKKGMLALCGEVNAKNSYGAYVGFKRFFATTLPELQQLAGQRPSDTDTFVLDRMWPSMCETEVAKVPE